MKGWSRVIFPSPSKRTSETEKTSCFPDSWHRICVFAADNDDGGRANYGIKCLVASIDVIDDCHDNNDGQMRMARMP